MLCPKCMAQIPDDSRKCPRCRAVILDSAPILASTDVAKDIPQQEKQIRSLSIGVTLALASVLVGGVVAHRIGERRRAEFTNAATARKAAPSQAGRIRVAKTKLVMRPGAILSFKFAVPPGCASATLQAQFVPGSEPGAVLTQMTVFDEDSYAKWRSHAASRAVYTSKIPTSLMNLSLPIDPRTYFLVFSQGASTLPTTVQADVELLCGSAS
jgi:hypothetical protein